MMSNPHLRYILNRPTSSLWSHIGIRRMPHFIFLDQWVDIDRFKSELHHLRESRSLVGLGVQKHYSAAFAMIYKG